MGELEVMVERGETQMRSALEQAREEGRAERARIVDELDERLRAVTQREAILRSSIQTVMRAEEAMEACLTCMVCMRVMVEPVTCSPCGHTFCSGCFETAEGGGCPECENEATGRVRVGMLGTLISKFNFQKQTLSSLNVSTPANSGKFTTAVGSRASA